MNSHIVMRKCLVILILSFATLHESASRAMTSEQTSQDKAAVLRFDAIIELHAPLCKTYVVLFARYWVSPTTYRMALIWGEPHASSFNFPIYAPTLNVESNPQKFLVEHQFKHEYDGIFNKPIGQRGPFLYKFNTYAFSDIRFAEKEALDLRIHTDDFKLSPMSASKDEKYFDINVTGTDKTSPYKLLRINVSTSKGCIDELRLLDPNGILLKDIEYEYNVKEGNRRLLKQNVMLSEQPITVGFKGKKPVVTINGKKSEISQFKTPHHAGGRKCVVDYESINLGGRQVSLPVKITVKHGTSEKILRSAKLYNFTYSKLSSDEIDKAAQQFSYFTDSEMKCREMLVKYWVKDPAEVAKADVEILKQLHKHFSGKSTKGLNIGEQLRHVNVLLQLDWMLGHTDRLESDFKEYLSLLASHNLDRMILIGGQNVIELTTNWGELDVAEKLLNIWVNEAVARNNAEVTLEYASMLLEKKRYWTTAMLMDRLLEMRQFLPAQRFVASAIRSLGLERIYRIVKHPDLVTNERKESDIVQAGWVSYYIQPDILERDLRKSIVETKELFAKLEQPTRDHKALMAQIEKVDSGTQ